MEKCLGLFTFYKMYVVVVVLVHSTSTTYITLVYYSILENGASKVCMGKTGKKSV